MFTNSTKVVQKHVYKQINNLCMYVYIFGRRIAKLSHTLGASSRLSASHHTGVFCFSLDADGSSDIQR
jgi:hypothetical protein